jgi:hypothetical protein
MSLESETDASEPQRRLKQWNIDGGMPSVLQNTCQPGTVNGHRIYITLLCMRAGGVVNSNKCFPFFFSG